MALTENRQSMRFDIFLIAEFRKAKGLHDYATGVIGDFSPEGCCLESQAHDLKPGERVELILRHPGNKSSVSALGEIIWKGETWYKCMAGIRFSGIDPAARDRIAGFISQQGFSVHEDAQ